MNLRFNLVDEPWLPCVQNDGQPVELGLYDALVQAHTLRELHETWRAMTRLTRPSVKLVCLHRQADSVTLDLGNGQPIVLDEPPTWRLAAKLAERVVTISNYPVVKHFLDQEPPLGWQKHPMLRYYRAAIFTQGRIDLNDSWLILDSQLGIMIENKEG